MAEKAGKMLVRNAPAIVSEIKVDFNRIFQINQRIVDTILNTDTDTLVQVGLLNRLLPNLLSGDACVCACTCMCMCSCACGDLQWSLEAQTGRATK